MSQFLLEKEKKNRDTQKKIKIYVCLYCKKEFPFKQKEQAEKHIENHDFVLVPIALNDLGKLIQFFYLKEDRLISPHLVKLLKGYAQRAIRNGH